jgi:hypothetical protein
MAFNFTIFGRSPYSPGNGNGSAAAVAAAAAAAAVGGEWSGNKDILFESKMSYKGVPFPVLAGMVLHN